MVNCIGAAIVLLFIVSVESTSLTPIIIHTPSCVPLVLVPLDVVYSTSSTAGLVVLVQLS